MITSTETPVRPADARGARTVLAIGAGLSVVAVAIAVVGLLVDPAEITGAPAWMKPAKFSFSIAVYLLTMRWILGFVRGHSRLLLVLSTGIVAGLVAEMVLVDLQVLRGTTSHYNEATAFDAGVFYAMGGIVTIVLIATIAAGVLALRQRGLDAGLAAGLRWGIAVSVLGMAAAVTMIFNKQWNDSGGHTVGAPDGGPGMPITGWSLEHGDLRIGHFVGLHALQLLPLLAWALQRWTGWDAPTRARLLRIAGVAYIAVVALLVWQASRGQSILQPDVPTLGAAAVIAGLAIVAAAVVNDRWLRSRGAASRNPRSR
jgi:hypothetical protein